MGRPSPPPPKAAFGPQPRRLGRQVSRLEHLHLAGGRVCRAWHLRQERNMIPARTPAQPMLSRGEDTSAQELVSRRAMGLGALARFLARDRALDWVLAGSVASLIWFSFRLAAMRMFQVDECNNIFAARMVATGQAHSNLGNIDLFQLALAP